MTDMEKKITGGRQILFSFETKCKEINFEVQRNPRMSKLIKILPKGITKYFMTNFVAFVSSQIHGIGFQTQTC